MKELLDFLKDRMTNKFSIPFLFFFIANNWIAFVWLLLEKNPEIIICNISTYIDQRGYWCFLGVPFLEAIIFSLASPWISLLIETLTNWPAFLRNKERIDSQKKMILAKLSLAELEDKLDRQQKISGLLRNGADQTVFGNLSSKLDEAGLKSTLKCLQDKESSTSDIAIAIDTLRKYADYAALVDQRYRDDVLRRKQDKVLESIDFIVKGFEKDGNLGANNMGKYLKYFSDLGLRYQDYRETVRNRLGI